MSYFTPTDSSHIFTLGLRPIVMRTVSNSMADVSVLSVFFRISVFHLASCTTVFVRTSIPASLNEYRILSDASDSSQGMRCLFLWISVTCTPRCANASASSHPTYPHPTMASFLMSRVTSNIFAFVKIFSSSIHAIGIVCA